VVHHPPTLRKDALERFRYVDGPEFEF